jgi:radical SAM protein with 4Fe4S-binding SPASM domain
MNVERFIDIQPNGSVNFCTDFPDVIIGNVMENSIKEIWNSEMAQKFRNIRNEKVLPVCVRCGAKYMSEIPNKIA